MSMIRKVTQSLKSIVFKILTRSVDYLQGWSRIPIKKSKTDTLVLTLVVILSAAWLPTHAGKIYWSENSCGAAGCTGSIVRSTTPIGSSRRAG